MMPNPEGRPLTYEGEPLGQGMQLRMTARQKARAEAMVVRLQELEDEKAEREGREPRVMKLAHLMRYAVEYLSEQDAGFKRAARKAGK